MSDSMNVHVATTLFQHMKIWKTAHREDKNVAAYMLIGFQSKILDYMIWISVHFF